MENNSFEYKGMIFTAYKNLKGGSEEDFLRVARKCVQSNITPEGYDYDQFYETAKKKTHVQTYVK